LSATFSTSSAFVMHFDLRKKGPIAQRPNLMEKS